MYRIRLRDLEYPRPVPRGNIDSFVQPLKSDSSPELSAGKGAESSSKVPVQRLHNYSDESGTRQGEVSAGIEQAEGLDTTNEASSCTEGGTCTDEASIGTNEASRGTEGGTCTDEASIGTNEASRGTEGGTCTDEASIGTNEASRGTEGGTCTDKASRGTEEASSGIKDASSSPKEATSGTKEASISTKAARSSIKEASSDTEEASNGTLEAICTSNDKLVNSAATGYVDDTDGLDKLLTIQGKISPKMKSDCSSTHCTADIRTFSGASCAETTEKAQQKAWSDLFEGALLKDVHGSCTELANIEKKDAATMQIPTQDVSADKQELLARAEQLKVGLSQDVDLLGVLHRELCDASESVTDIANNFRTLLQRASNESAQEISSQVSRLLESQGKLQQQIMMTEGLLVDSKKSLKELDDIEMETRGAAAGKPASSKSLRRVRGMVSKNRIRRKCDDDKEANESSNGEEEDDDSSEGSENSDAGSQTDSNASSKGESRRHKVVSSLLHRHTKKQHMRLAPKRRPPAKPLEAGERVCVEVTHTWTLVDIMWQVGYIIQVYTMFME